MEANLSVRVGGNVSSSGSNPVSYTHLAIVEGLALRIVEKKVSRILFDKRVIALDMTAVVAGTKYRGPVSYTHLDVYKRQIYNST